MARRRLIRLRRGTAAEWTAANPTLEAGEPGVETDTGQGKIGDGSTAWNSLDYIGAGGGGDVATDVIWNAKGDLAVGTGSDTASRLAVGANDTILVADSGQATGVKWAAVPGISGYVPLATIDAKGDLLVGSANDAVDNLTVGTDGHVLTADSAQTLGVKWAAAAGGGAVATDAIWDAKGDLAIGSGADAANNLAVGTNGQLLAANSGETLGVEWVDAPGMDLETPSGTINSSNVTFTLSSTPSPSGNLLLFKNGLLQEQGVDYTLSGATITFTTAPATGSTLLAAIPVVFAGGGGGVGVLDLVTRTTDLTVTASSSGTAQDWIVGNAVTYDGSTQILVEVFCPFQNATTSAELIWELVDGASSLGRIGQFDFTGSAYAAWVLTPTAASHTYKITAWRTSSNRTLTSASPFLGSYYRITES